MGYYRCVHRLWSCVLLLNFSLLIAMEDPQIVRSAGQAFESFSVVLGDLPEITTDARILEEPTEEIEVKIMPIPQELAIDPEEIVDTYSFDDTDRDRQPLAPTPPPTLTFQALNDSLTVIPPDTQGTVGLNHLMTTLNDRVRIQSKTGTDLRTVSLRTFWGLASSSQAFDPKIVYDQLSNRWIFTALSDGHRPSSMVLLAVSQTSDPLGAWNIYRIKADPTATTTTGVWADYPSIGFNPTWIVVQVNMFNIANNAFNRSHVYVFNKTELYLGGAGNFRLFTLANTLGGTQVPAVTYDPNLTLYLLQNFNGNSNGRGHLRLYSVTGLPGAETLNNLGLISIASPWASNVSVINGGFAAQLNITRRIMNGDARMQNVVVRNGSLWATQTAFLPTGTPARSIIQWWQINPATRTIQQFGRIQDPNANLNAGTFYAYPSIAVNIFNDVLIGYSFFSPLIYASAGYSFRLGTDPVNTMQTMWAYKDGLDIYTKDFGSGRVRWGDYSSTIVDVNGIDFWTIQESADTRSGTTTRWTTWWAKVQPRLTLPLPLPLDSN